LQTYTKIPQDSSLIPLTPVITIDPAPITQAATVTANSPITIKSKKLQSLINEQEKRVNNPLKMNNTSGLNAIIEEENEDLTSAKPSSNFEFQTYCKASIQNQEAEQHLQQNSFMDRLSCTTSHRLNCKHFPLYILM